MTVSNFDSFDASGFDAFIESPLSARQSAIGDRLLMWPGEGASRPEGLTTVAGFVIEQIAPQWDTQETWSGNVNDYRSIICNGYFGSLNFWEDVTEPSWYGAVRNGEWTGRVQLGAIRRRDVAERPRPEPRATPVREFMSPLAESFGMVIGDDVWADRYRPYNSGPPASDHLLTKDVVRVGYGNFDGSNWRGTQVIDGEGVSLVNIGVNTLPSAARVVDRTFPTGNKVSMLLTDAIFGTPGDSGLYPGPYWWFESSRQLGRNFWNVPV